MSIAMPQWALELLHSAPVARLGMLDGAGAPRVLPVVFVAHAGAIWSPVDAKPKRVAPDRLARLRFISRDGRVSLCVDHYEADWGRLCWLQLLGRARVVAVGPEQADGVARAGAEAGAQDTSGVLAALAAKYEQYRQASVPGPLVRIAPERCIFWHAAGRRAS